MKIPSRERTLSRRKCGREGKRLVMQNIGMRPHCCERFEGEMNLLIMHKLAKGPPLCPRDLWTSDFPSKLTNLYKCWSFMQFQTGAVCLWKPTHFHVSIWMGMVAGGRLPIIEKQGCLRETFMLFLFLDWHPIETNTNFSVHETCLLYWWCRRQLEQQENLSTQKLSLKLLDIATA